jgi:NifU-like protein involved in Fe-S cluster formation
MDINKGEKGEPNVEGDIKKVVHSCAVRNPAPIPQEGSWTRVKEIKDISGLTHGVGGCAPQQGACKLTLNVKEGIIQEALVETIGCSGMTQSAAMAGEILPGKSILEALNTDLVCDAINVAMRELFLQIVYGRTQTAFSAGGLPVGAGMEELGKNLRSHIGTIYGSRTQGPRYLEITEGYVLSLALDAEDEVIGYQYVNMGAMLRAIREGKEPNEAFAEAVGTYGRYHEGKTFIDPRRE